MAVWIDWLDKLKDPRRSPYERRYRLLSLMTSIVILLWVIVSFARGINLQRAVVGVIVLVIYTALWLLALRYGKTQLHARSVAIVLIFLVLPATFIFFGGIQSGAPYWCLLTMTYTISTVSGKWKVALIVCDLLMAAGCFIFTYLNPEYIVQLSLAEAYLNAVTQLTGNLLITGSMFFFQLYMARQEREFLTAQQNEIEVLSLTQGMQQEAERDGNGERSLRPGEKLPVRIAVDSGCDVPEQWKKRFGIAVINNRIHTGAGTFEDVVETNTDGLFRHMASDHSVRSEAPSIEDFLHFFTTLLEGAEQVIFITQEKLVSKSHERACAAAGKTGHVTVIDSGHMSCAAGLLAAYAAHLAETEGVSEGFFDKLESFRQRIQHSLLLEDTEHLVRNGRMGRATQRLMQAFLMHPVITARSGGITVKGIVTGDTLRNRERYIRFELRRGSGIDRTLVILVHAGLQNRELQEICTLIRKQTHFDRIAIQELSPALAGNAGSGCIGFVYCMRDIREKGGAFTFLPEDFYEEMAV